MNWEHTETTPVSAAEEILVDPASVAPDESDFGERDSGEGFSTMAATHMLPLST